MEPDQKGQGPGTVTNQKPKTPRAAIATLGVLLALGAWLEIPTIQAQTKGAAQTKENEQIALKDAPKPTPAKVDTPPGKTPADSTETGSVNLQTPQATPHPQTPRPQTPEATAKKTGSVTINPPAVVESAITGQSVLNAGRVQSTPLKARTVVLVLEESTAREVLKHLLESDSRELYIITDSPVVATELGKEN